MEVLSKLKKKKKIYHGEPTLLLDDTNHSGKLGM